MELRRSLKCEVIETVFGLPSFTSWPAWMPKSMPPTMCTLASVARSSP
jgi:hypothetical protein